MENSLTARFTKRYPGGVEISADLSLRSDRHTMTILYGPSGCGKTTILRCLAGLDQPSTGMIQMANEVWFDGEKGINCSPQKRHCGFVFQDYALFPHLNVANNVGFGLHLERGERMELVNYWLERLELNGLGKRRIYQISAGQRQRVALGRALILRPRLILMDEPFAALDTMLRKDLRQQMKETLDESKIPCILVTHDPWEAKLIGDQIAIMEHGRILQYGDTSEVFQSPKDKRIAELLGQKPIK